MYCMNLAVLAPPRHRSFGARQFFVTRVFQESLSLICTESPDNSGPVFFSSQNIEITPDSQESSFMGAVDSRFIPCVVPCAEEPTARIAKCAIAPTKAEVHTKCTQVIASPIYPLKVDEHDKGARRVSEDIPPKPFTQAVVVTNTNSSGAVPNDGSSLAKARPNLGRSQSSQPTSTQQSQSQKPGLSQHPQLGAPLQRDGSVDTRQTHPPFQQDEGSEPMNKDEIKGPGREGFEQGSGLSSSSSSSPSSSFKKCSSMHNFSLLVNKGTEERRKKGILKKSSSEDLKQKFSGEAIQTTTGNDDGGINGKAGAFTGVAGYYVIGQEGGLSAGPGLKRAALSYPELSMVLGEEKAMMPRRGIRFSETKSMMKIDSHTDLSQMERDSIYYERSDMTNFVRYELTRRKAKGITSTSALAPEAESAGELDDDEDEELKGVLAF